MNSDFDFSDLFVFDMANNHQGDLEHGVRIVKEVGRVAKKNDIKGAMKFQFRDLETFIHPSHKKDSDNKHIPRFLSTALSKNEFGILIEEVRQAGLITISTPFDENSVDLIDDLEIELIKVASCSAKDWPLLERVAQSYKPVIVSTAGLNWDEIDDLVSFLDHRRVHFSLMHCVAIYPIPEKNFQLNQISQLKNRYPSKVIGFSTHENPEDLFPVVGSVAKGAEILERHVGVQTVDIKLNAYSSTPEQLNAWIQTAKKAKLLCGSHSRPEPPAVEVASLLSLKRGVYAKRKLKEGERLKKDSVYFAMPCLENQVDSGGFMEGIDLNRNLEKHEPLIEDSLRLIERNKNQILISAVHSIKAMLNEARIALNTDFETEFSHHMGKDKFFEVGATIITCIDRTYCKKLIILLPGQHHPSHYHKKKEETFQVLYGELGLNIEGRKRTLYPGDIQLVQQGVWHEFWSNTGTIFEEVSSKHYNDDSYYENKEINRMDRADRKTVVNQWGRFQLNPAL